MCVYMASLLQNAGMALLHTFHVRQRWILILTAIVSVFVFFCVYLPWTSSPSSSSASAGSRRLSVVNDYQRYLADLPEDIASRVIRNLTRNEDVWNLHQDDPGDLLSKSLYRNYSSSIKGKLLPENNGFHRIPSDNQLHLDFGGQTGELRHHARHAALGASRGKCSPQHNIVFWKTHKCASSTIQNIMFRHAEKYDLRFVLPARSHLFNLFSRFNATKDVPAEFRQREHPFNMFAHHARFSAPDVATLMPPDSMYVTILRYPVTLYESIYAYLQLPSQFGIGSHHLRLRYFLKNPTRYYKPTDTNVHRRYARNPLLYDLGLEPEDMDSKAKIAETILDIQLRFHLVMIAEYFDESLILLKDLLCWDFEDVAYLKLNARDKVRHVTPYVSKLLQTWNQGDMHLYQYFNDTFWRRVEHYGYERMARDVATLRQVNDRLMARCIEEVKNAGDIDDQESVWHPAGIDIVGYKLKDSSANDRLCKNIIKPEKLFTDEFRMKQGDYYFPKKTGMELERWKSRGDINSKIGKVMNALIGTKPSKSPDIDVH